LTILQQHPERGTEDNRAIMLTPHPIVPAGEHVIDRMIALARCTKRQRIIVAGTHSAEHMFELHRQGHVRVTTTAHCGLPAGQYDVALIDWRGRSIKALDATLDWLVDFLDPAGALIVWVDPQRPAGNRSLQSVLERHGLAVEAGTIHAHGSAISARRGDRTAARAAA
jgi:hypothetical protein